MMKEAEDLVREVLRAYNMRKDPLTYDLNACHAIAERYLARARGKREKPKPLPPGVYEVKP